MTARAVSGPSAPPAAPRATRRGTWAAGGTAVAASVGVLATWWLVATQTWVVAWDAEVAREAAGDRLPWLTPWVLRFTDLAGTTLLPVLVGVAAVVLTALRRFRAALGLVGALVASAALMRVAKLLVGRPRPPAALMAAPAEHGLAFPSGHATTATAVLLVGAGLIAGATRRPGVRAAAWAAAVAGLAAVAASRVYLDYHWATDVVAGVLLGTAVAAVTLLLLRVTPRPSRRRPPARG